MDVDDDEVRLILGKMFTNFGDLEVGPDQARGCGYYPIYANMNHACRFEQSFAQYLKNIFIYIDFRANTKTFKGRI